MGRGYIWAQSKNNHMLASTGATKMSVISGTMFSKIENKTTRPYTIYVSNCF